MMTKFSGIRIGIFGLTILFTGINVNAQPGVPVLFSPGDCSVQIQTRPVLYWNASPGADKYTLQVSLDSLFGTFVYNDTSIVDTCRQVGPLANNRTYYWCVSAKNGDGSSAFSGEWSFTTLPAPEVQTTTQISSFISTGSKPRGLAWDGEYLWMIDNIGNLYQYDTTGTEVKTIQGEFSFDSDLSWDGTGLWIGGASVGGGALKIDTDGNRIDSLPVHYSDGSGMEWDGQYFWFGDYDLSEIHKYRSNGSEFLNWEADDITGHPTGITYDGIRLWIGGSGGTTSNTIYKYSILGDLIYSFDLNDIGITAGSGSFISLAWDSTSLWYAADDGFDVYRLRVPYYHEAPSVPVIVSPEDEAEIRNVLTPVLRWNAVLDAARYHVQVSEDPAFPTLIFEDSTIIDTWVQVGPLEDNITYYWHVSAENSGGTSTYSGTFSFTVYDDPPSDPSGLVAIPGNGQVKLCWDPNSEPDINKYRIYRNKTSPANILTDSITGSPPGTLYVDTDVTNDSLYFFRITAVDNAGTESGFSNEVVAVPVIEQGNALLLDGSDDYVDAGTGNALDDLGSEFTVEGWMYYHESVIDHAIFGSVSDGEERRISLRSNAFTIQPDGQGYSEIVMDDPVDTGWHHLAGTYDGSNIRLYVDGILQGTQPVSGTLDPSPTFNDIGRQGFGWHMEGQIDEVCIWNMALSSEEIKNTICRPVRANSPGLLALWHFDEPDTCSTAYDASASMIHGTLMNGASFTRSHAMAPVAPSGLGIYEYSDQSVTLQWNANTDCDLRNYRIYRDTSSPAAVLYDSVYGSPPDTLYTDTDVDFDTTYYYRITAVDSLGNEGAFSEQLVLGDIVVDGIKDPFWETATAHIHLGQDEIVGGEADDDNDFSADLYLAYDSLYLYGFVEVKDDSVSSKSGCWWDNDAFSLRLDPVPDSTVRVDWGSDDEPNWRDIIDNIEFTTETGYDDERNGTGNTIISRVLTDTGYIVEFAVPEEEMINNNTDPSETVLLQEGTQIGFYFELADQDEESEREAMLAWGHSSVNINSRKNVTQYGSMTFLSGNQIQLSRDNLVMAEDQPYIQAPHIHSHHWLEENFEGWGYHLYVYANDPQGLEDIDSVWAEGPEGGHYRLYDDATNGDNWPGGDGRYYLEFGDDSPIPVGEYTFYVRDGSGTLSFVSDSLTSDLEYPENLVPVHNSIVSDPGFLIDWDEVPGATGYYISVNLVSDWELYWGAGRAPDSTSAKYNDNSEGKALVEGEVYCLTVYAGNNRNTSFTKVKIAYMIQSSIVIDGIKDAFWDIAAAHIHLGEDELVWGEADDEDDCSADVYLAYDSVYLYGYVEVKDDMTGSEAGWWWNNDAVSLKFDTYPDSVIPVSYGSWEEPNRRDIVSIDITAETGFDGESSGNEYTILSRAQSDSGYVIEFAIQEAGLENRNTDPPEPVLLQEGTQIGFYFEMADQDEGTEKEAVLAWGHESANMNSGKNVTQFGSITFLADNQVELSHDNLVMEEEQPYIQIPSIWILHRNDENLNERWHHHFYVYANDPQGLDDIDSVWIEGPDGSHYRLYDNEENGDEYGGDGLFCSYKLYNYPPALGIYYFRAIDKAGNEVSVADTLTGLLDYPEIVLPAGAAIITEPDFQIDWTEVPDASYYSVSINRSSDGDHYWYFYIEDPDQTSVNYNENGEGRDLIEGEIYYLYINAGKTRNESQTRIKFTYAPQALIMVDGIRDSFWDTATGHIHLGENEVVWGDIDDESDCSADVYLAYDSLFLYGFVEVTDDTMGSEYDWWWDNDAFVLRFDTDPATLVEEEDASDILSLEFTARNDADDRRNGGDEYDDNAPVLLSRNINDQGYILEFAVSAEGLVNTGPDPDEALALEEGTQAGFLFQMADEDSIQGREAELAWGHYSVSHNSEDNVAQYGSITLLADNQIQFSHDNLVMDEYQPFMQIADFYSSYYSDEYSTRSEAWDLNVSLYINDPQGLDDVDSVWVEDPEGSYYLLNDNNEGCDNYKGDGTYAYCSSFDAPFATGAYHFNVIDKSGNLNSITDTLPEFLNSPNIIMPAHNSIVSFSDLMIEWDEVPGATKYVVVIASLEDGSENWFWWSGLIMPDQSSVKYTGQELEIGKVYTIQVSAYCERTYSTRHIRFSYRTDNRRTIHVNSANTSGVEYGTRDFPFPTIQEGIDATILGDTVLVYPGTYMENVNLNNAGGLVLGSLFLVTGDTGFVTRTVIDGNGKGSAINVWNCWQDTINICGFTITGGSNGGIRAGSANLTIYNSIINDNISDQEGGGISFNDGTLRIINSKILNNYAPDNSSGIKGSNCEIYICNSLIAKNYGYSCLSWQSVSGSIINSTIADNPDRSLAFHDSYIQVRNSIDWNNNQDGWDEMEDVLYSVNEGDADGTGNIVADPMFVDAEAGDYRLQVSSPCINFGTPDTAGLNIPTTDLAGNQRIFDGRIDMGAYEFNEDLAAMILYTDTAVTVDGEITESIWERSDKYHINKVFTGETFDDQDDLSAYWKAVWDEDGIYVLVEVTADDTLVTDETYGMGSEQDLVEIYFDMNTDNLADGAGPSEGIYVGNPTNGHYVFAYKRGSEFATLLGWQSDCEVAIIENEEDATSVQELFVPWSLITDKEGNVFVPDEKISIGFDVYIADNDGPDNGDERNRKIWVNDGTYGDGAWTNMDHCGKIQLSQQATGSLGVTVTAGKSSVCPGEEVQLNAVPEGETGTCYYTWTSDPPGPVYAFSDPVVSPEVTTTYYIEVTDQENSVTDSVTITVLSLPVIDAGPDMSIQYNTSVTLNGTASGGSGFYSYDWSPGDSLDYSFVQNPSTCRLRGSSLFTLSATDYGTGCTNTDQVLVTVTGSTLDAGISVSRDTICTGETVNLLATPSGGTGDYSYTWTSDPEGFTSSLAGPSDTPAGNITYYLVVSDGMDSDSASQEIVVYVPAEPESPDVSVCYGDEVLPLTALGNAIKWYDDNTLSKIIGLDDTLQTGMSSIGKYSCYVTQTDKNCVSPAAEVVLEIIELPEITVNLTDTVLEEGGTVRLTASGAEGFSWAPSAGLDKTTGDTVFASPDENTVYTVTGSNGVCSKEVQIYVNILCNACDEEQVIFDQEGAINYCSTNRVYPGNIDCSWLIYPSGVTSVYLLFDTIDIKPGDYVSVYDGFYEDNQLLGEFDNDHLPTGQIQSGSMLYILFHSDDIGTGLGFRARYRSDQPVGTGAGELISGLNIYPNPVTGLLNIEFTSHKETDLTINVFNTLLQLLINKDIHAMAGRNHAVIDMTGLGSGIYYLQISSGSGNTVRKVIVR